MNRPDFDQFLAEYFVECDEHLDASRHSLLALEACIGSAEPDRQLLDELFRSFHSIKGLSAMVGVGEAEVLAHQLETYLGDLRKGRLRLSANGLEVMIAGVKMLDHILAARRRARFRSRQRARAGRPESDSSRTVRTCNNQSRTLKTAP